MMVKGTYCSSVNVFSEFHLKKPHNEPIFVDIHELTERDVAL